MEMNRLRWASRRGMLELDLILVPFLENIYPALPGTTQALFEKLLTCEDQDMFNWFLHKVEPQDADIKTIVDIILDHTGLKQHN